MPLNRETKPNKTKLELSQVLHWFELEVLLRKQTSLENYLRIFKVQRLKGSLVEKFLVPIMASYMMFVDQRY